MVAYLASPPSIGNTTAGSGAFTTLSASGTVSGTGFSNYLASPPAIGGTAANAAVFAPLKTTAGLRVNAGGVTSNSASTLTLNQVAIVNGGIFVQTGTTASTWTLPTGTQMDAAISFQLANYDQCIFLVSNASTQTITMAAGSGFTLAGTWTVATNQSRVFFAIRTGTNTWVLY